ncbi:MAG: hypothetical protein R3B60_03890 [Candidatus Paceibacterota bacterium]
MLIKSKFILVNFVKIKIMERKTKNQESASATSIVNNEVIHETPNLDTHNYKGWLNSDHFWKRSLGIFLYYSVSSFVISAIIIFIIIIIMLGIGYPLPIIINKILTA